MTTYPKLLIGDKVRCPMTGNHGKVISVGEAEEKFGLQTIGIEITWVNREASTRRVGETVYYERCNLTKIDAA